MRWFHQSIVASDVKSHPEVILSMGLEGHLLFCSSLGDGSSLSGFSLHGLMLDTKSPFLGVSVSDLRFMYPFQECPPVWFQYNFLTPSHQQALLHAEIVPDLTVAPGYVILLARLLMSFLSLYMLKLLIKCWYSSHSAAEFWSFANWMSTSWLRATVL